MKFELCRIAKPVSIVAAMAAWAFASANAQDEQQWLQELRQQVDIQHDCNVNYFLNAFSYRLGDEKVYEARIVCVDGRQFDASRTGDSDSFSIRSCEPVVC